MSDELARRRDERLGAARQKSLDSLKDMRRRVRTCALAAGEDDEDALTLLREVERQLKSGESPTRREVMRTLTDLSLVALRYTPPAKRARAFEEFERILGDFAREKPPASVRQLRGADSRL